MKIPPEKMAVFSAKVNSKFPRPGPCPVCNTIKWSINDEIFEIPPYIINSPGIGSPIFPVVALVCQTCGYTRFLSAVIAGVVDANTGALTLD